MHPETLLSGFNQEQIRSQPLYNQPEFCELIKPGKLRYGMVISDEGTGNFPLTTDRLFLQRRIFMLPFCQRFQPFTRTNEMPEPAYFQNWLEWIQDRVGSFHWAFSGHENLPGTRERTNQFLPLGIGEESIFSRWSKGRKSALGKSKNLEVISLSHEEFSTRLRQLNQLNENKEIWSPNQTEKQSILRISNSKFFEQKVIRFGVFEGLNCLNLTLLVFWNQRWHYLFSQSANRGLEKDASTRFFHSFLQLHAGSETILDFEGSSIPGVQAFFRSLGADAERYSEIRN